jgi:Vacuole effluxer Atg22 like
MLARSPAGDKGQCVVYLLGMELNTASFAMYTFSISVLVQSFIIVSMSGAADHGTFLAQNQALPQQFAKSNRSLPQEISAVIRSHRRHCLHVISGHHA